MSRTRALLVIALATVAVRLVVLLWPGPDMYENGRVMAEELVRGVTAREVLHGPLMPLLDYQQPFWGGHIVVAVVAAPFLALFGTNLLALRLATLPFALLMSLAGFALLDRCAGRRAAWIGGLLLALPPPGFLLLSCTLQGTHAECVGLGLASVLLLVRALEAPTRARTAWFGFACGFDLWFGYPALFAPVLVGVGLLLTKRRLPRWDHVVSWILAFLVGAAPWLVLARTPYPSTRIYGLPNGAWFDASQALSHALHTLRELATQDFALSLWLPGSTQAAVGAGAFGLALALLVLWTFGLWSSRVRIAALWKPALRAQLAELPDVRVWLVLLAAVPVALLMTSKFELGPRDWLQNLRYLLPVWPLMAFGIAIGIDALPRVAGKACAAAILVCLAAALAGRLDWSRFAHDACLEVAPVRTHARMVAWLKRTDPEALARVVTRVEQRDPAEQEEFLHALGLWIRWWYAQDLHARSPRTEDAQRMQALLRFLRERVDPRWQEFFVADADETVLLEETVESFRARRPGAAK